MIEKQSHDKEADMKKYKIYINGDFVDSESKKEIAVFNPANDEQISTVPDCIGGDVDRAVRAAREAQKKWRKISPVERAVFLRKMAESMRKNVDAIATAVTLEQGKPLPHAKGEVLEVADLMDYHAEWARRIEGQNIQSDSTDENIIVYKEPIGVVACILPWNFPIYVMVRKLAPALITGNTVVLKPSSETPNSVLEFAKAISDIGLPPGVINVITGKGSVAGLSLCSHPGVGFVSVTGSVEAGEEIMRACAKNITKVSLELGGKAPAVVMNDADLDLAVSCILRSRISNAGQVCTCAERVYVQDGIAEAFTKKMIEAMKKVTIGDGMKEPHSMMGPMINHGSVDRVDGMVKQAVSQGAVVRTGARKPERKGSFYEPTLLTGCRQEMEIMHKEIFGPVLPMMAFKTAEEVVGYANDCEYGLTATLYTKDLNTALLFSNEVEFGELYINRKQGEAFQGYHAGWKKSGIGGDDGKYGMEEFLRTRVVYLKRT